MFVWCLANNWSCLKNLFFHFDTQLFYKLKPTKQGLTIDQSDFISFFIRPIRIYSTEREGYLMYFSMNFLWNSDLKVSLMNALFFLSSSPFAQFLNTTSSSHLHKKKNELYLHFSVSLSKIALRFKYETYNPIHYINDIHVLLQRKQGLHDYMKWK